MGTDSTRSKTNGPCACGRFKKFPSWLPPLSDGIFHLPSGETQVCEVLELRDRVSDLEGILRDLLAWADSGPVRAVEVAALVHGVAYTAADVAVWDRARALAKAES